MTLQDVSSDTVGTCFDTTAVKSGEPNGACVPLQKSLVLYSARHYHLCELIIGKIFTVLSGHSCGSYLKDFKPVGQILISQTTNHLMPLA